MVGDRDARDRSRSAEFARSGPLISVVLSHRLRDFPRREAGPFRSFRRPPPRVGRATAMVARRLGGVEQRRGLRAAPALDTPPAAYVTAKLEEATSPTAAAG